MKKAKINKRILIIMVILICVIFIAGSYSKYIKKEENIHIQGANEFYFESNIAESEEGKEYNISKWNGEKKEIKFKITNYTDKLQKTEDQNENSTYKISAKVTTNENLVEVKIKNAQGVEITDNDTISNLDFNEEEYTLSIVAKDIGQLTTGQEFDVNLELTSIEPYAKKLIANIKLTYSKVSNRDTCEQELQEAENGEYVKLNIRINEVQDITIKYDNTKLMLDKSSNIVNDIEVNEAGNTSSFTIPKGKLRQEENYEIYFMKKQSGTIVLGTDIQI